jgi:hypothetical protein
MAKSSKSAAKRSPQKAAAKASTSKTAKAASGKRAGNKNSITKPKPGEAKSGARKAALRTRKALRLIFSYEGDKVKLVSKEPVRMTLPPSDSLEGYEEHQGFWAELKNARKKTLYRHVLHNPTKNDAEIFSEEGITRLPAPNRTGVFVVLVPDTAKGHEVTLSRSAGIPVTPEGSPGYAVTSMPRSLAAGPAMQFKSIKLKK